MQTTDGGPSGYRTYSDSRISDSKDSSEQEINTDKTDLAEILVAGVNAKYGSEKAEQVKSEFAKLAKPNYRTNAESLIGIVERVCGDTGLTASKSIDKVVENYSEKPSKLKVAVNGTANLVNKTCWYYPLVGALPGKYQEKIAERLGDDPRMYTATNVLLEAAVAAYIVGSNQDSPITSLATGAITFVMSGIFGLIFRSMPGEYRGKGRVTGSSLLLPLTLAKYALAAVRDAYASACQEQEEHNKH